VNFGLACIFKEIFHSLFMTSVFKYSVLSLLLLLSFVASSQGETLLLEDSESQVLTETNIERPKLVFAIPINEAINQANLFVLRRGLKEAIRKNADMVILDMDTPGGRLDICLEMMEMLDFFEGRTATYVNPDAISAGAFIASACDKIYFSPKGKMGAAAVIQGTGEDVPDTARMKIESYLLANIRVLSEGYRYRTEVIRAMFDANYELIVDGILIKSQDELLTLTAKQAFTQYGDPAEPLLADGVADSIEEILNQEFGANGYRLERYKITYSEEWAKWLANITPILLGAGMLFLFIEFKTPGFGVFGIGGIFIIGLFFISQNIAGLAGNEAMLFFALGLICLGVEIFVLPGFFIFGLLGLILIIGSLLFAMTDFWPGQGSAFSFELLQLPLLNLVIALGIAILGALVFARLLRGSFIERTIVLSSSLNSKEESEEEALQGELIGKHGITITRLNPSGIIEIEGKQYEAHAEINYIEKGKSVLVCSMDNFKIDVKELSI
jgi:membrane-bound serine protease (ClpP class)